MVPEVSAVVHASNRHADVIPNASEPVCVKKSCRMTHAAKRPINDAAAAPPPAGVRAIRWTSNSTICSAVPTESLWSPTRWGWHLSSIADNGCMLLYLILILTVVPALELVIILQVHHAIASSWGSGMGLLVTIGTIAVTGIAGATLARQQGMSVLRELQKQMGQGQLPGQALMDGVLILIGAALLLTPGFLTDVLGFSLLIPLTRSAYRKLLRRWIRGKMQRGDVFVTVATSGSRKNDVSDQLGGPE